MSASIWNSIGHSDGRNFADDRQEATPEPDSDYAEWGIVIVN